MTQLIANGFDCLDLFEMVRTPTEVECAWGAGIIDGEGCILIKKSKNARGLAFYHLSLRLGMCHAETVERMRKIFCGSHLYYENREHHGNGRWHNVYRAEWLADAAIDAISLMRPYLVTKAEQADIVLRNESALRSRPFGLSRATSDVFLIRECVYRALRRAKGRNEPIGK